MNSENSRSEQRKSQKPSDPNSASQPSSPPTLSALTGLRGIAALVIAMGHIYVIGIDPRWQPNLTHLHRYVVITTSYPVPLFFILSGFILMYVYGRIETLQKTHWYGHFIGARLARLYPAYFVALSLMILPDYLVSFLPVKIDHPRHSIHEIITNYLLIQEWRPLVSSISFVTPTWAVSIEWFLYLATFPLMLWLYLRVKENRTFLISTALMMALLFVPIKYYATIGASILFGLGCVLYGLRHRFASQVKRYAQWSDLAAAGLVLVLITQYFDITSQLAPRIVTILLGLWILGLSFTGSFGSRVLSHPICVYLGEISYSLYVIHWVVFQVFYHTPLTMKISLEKSIAWYLIDGLIQTLSCLAAACILYHFVEIPGRNYFRAKFDLWMR